jgi:hypothetical protein
MVPVAVLLLSQLADGLTYTLAREGVELNPLMAGLEGGALPVKLAGAALAGLLAWRLRHRARVILWIAAFGWFGALSNFTGAGWLLR